MKTKRHLEWKIHQHFTVMFIDFDANNDNDYELRGGRMASGCSNLTIFHAISLITRNSRVHILIVIAKETFLSNHAEQVIKYGE